MEILHVLEKKVSFVFPNSEIFMSNKRQFFIHMKFSFAFHLECIIE